MTPAQLSPTFSVAPQINAADLADVKAQGFTTILINRPDGEEAGQPTAAQTTAAAQELGLTCVHVPLVPGTNPLEALPAFEAAIAAAKGPVLAHCKTGMRSAMLWALSQKGKQPADQILATARGAGFDLSMLANFLA